VNVLKSLLILPLAVSSESNLPFCVLLIDATLELKEPIELLKLLVVVATDEDKLPILELNPLVVVAIDELKEPIDDVNEELKLVIVLVNPDVVVATELEKDDVYDWNEPVCKNAKLSKPSNKFALVANEDETENEDESELTTSPPTDATALPVLVLLKYIIAVFSSTTLILCGIIISSLLSNTLNTGYFVPKL
jgi:hypothetical protein